MRELRGYRFRYTTGRRFAPWTVVRQSTLLGEPVEAPDGSELGNIADFLVEMEGHQACHAVISVGGAVGGRRAAVPCRALLWDIQNRTFVLGVTGRFLRNAPGYEGLPETLGENWDSEMKEFWSEQPEDYWFERWVRR